ncbi:MAG: UDP-2,4-diacetamido-2,4,6-trideoxy-beta-L-altropyranose hydrolase [Magnetococcus sp. XQGC-1]
MRTLSLAGRLRAAGARVQFICRAHPGHLIDWIEARKFTVHHLAEPVGVSAQSDGQGGAHAHWLHVTQEQDAQEVVAVLHSVGVIDWLVVDHYALDSLWERRVRPHVGRLLVIDDLADRPHVCDLLLDQNLHQEMTLRYQTRIPPHCTLLLGPQYALLRPEFASARDGMRERDGVVRRILIFFGGVDADNMTTKALEAMVALERPDLQVDVVVGRSNPHRGQVRALCDHRPWLHYHEQVDNMAQLMAQADLSIGAAGTTSWERCCLGLACVLVIVAANQRLVAHVQAAAGVAVVLGESGDVSSAQLTEVVRNVVHDPGQCRQMQKKAASLCDGLGVNRVAMALLPLFAKDGQPLGLRPATWADMEQVWEWQRAPGTRRYARHPQVPTIEEHRQWFAQRLQNSRCVFNIILHAQQPVGVLRLDRLPDAAVPRYEISIFLAPERYRLGIASGALQLARMLLPDAEFLAEVLEDNLASMALFQSLGYVRQESGAFICFPSKESLAD